MALIQSVYKNAGAVTSTTLAFTSAVTAGNCKLAFGYTATPSGGTQTASDNVDGTYHQAIITSATGGTVSINYFQNATGGAATVTLTSTPGNAQLRLIIAERDDIGKTNPLDQTATVSGSNFTVFTCGPTGSVSQANETVVAALGNGGGNVTYTAGTGYTLDPVGQNKLWVEYLSGAASGTQTAVFNGSGAATGSAVLATFLPAGQPSLSLGSGSFLLTGEAATLSTSSGAFTLSAATGSFALVGESTSLIQTGNFSLVLNPGAFDLVGGLGNSDYQMEAGDGVFALFGPPVTLNNSGATTFSLNLDFGTFALSGPAIGLSTSVQFFFIASVGSYTYQGFNISGSLQSGICAAVPNPQTVIVLEIITDAFQKIGVINETEFPSAEQGANGLRILNDFLLNESADGLRLGWFKQTDLSATAPLRQEDVWGVKMLLARKLAQAYGVAIQDPNLIMDIQEAERQMIKRSIQYFESDLSEFSRPQGGPWGGPNWI